MLYNLLGVSDWPQNNGLQLKSMQSEVIQFTATRGRDKVDYVTSVVVSNAIIQPVSSINTFSLYLAFITSPPCVATLLRVAALT